MRKPTRKGLIRKLDKAMSMFIVNRDKSCFTCGSTQNLTNGHLFTRAWYSVRWDELNCHCQCVGCNYRHEFDPARYQLKFIEKYGLEAYKELYRKAHQTRKWWDKELKELYEEIQAKDKLEK